MKSRRRRAASSGQAACCMLHATCCAGYGLLCARHRHRLDTYTMGHAACRMEQQVAGPVRWAYCAKKKINCVLTHNRAMNQNHTSWLYIDIRLSLRSLPSVLPLLLSWATCGLCAMQMQMRANGSKPVLWGMPRFGGRLPPTIEK